MTSAETTRVVIVDDNARRVVEAELWLRVYNVEVGECDLWNTLYAYGEVMRSGDASEIDVAMAALDERRAEIAAGRAATPGDTVTIALSAATLDKALENCQAVVEEDEWFWKAPADARTVMLAARAAAARLRSELGVGAVA